MKDEEHMPKKTPKKSIGARTRMSAKSWKAALEETRRKELEEGARFLGGKPFPIPSVDSDPVLPEARSNDKPPAKRKKR